MKTSEAKPIGLYIHIPFCARKCRYCDFTSYPVGDSDTHLAYVMKAIYEIWAKRALPVPGGGKKANAGKGGGVAVRDVNLGKAPLPVDTIYIGGGTPSFIEAGFVTELLDAVYAAYDVLGDAEITIEVNPGTANPEKFRRYRAAGVNRASIGAQSFDPGTLAFLGRVHTADDTFRCFESARDAGFRNISLDLIFGVPGQTVSAWEKDLEAAVSLSPEHISFYSLQIEEGTPLHADMDRGVFEAVDEVEDRRMYHMAKDFLEGNGLFLYEISNSAKPGMESRHNLKYWSMAPYIGIGVSAHSYFGGRRFSNTNSLATYLTAENHVEMTDWVHENTLLDDMSEFIFLGLRRTAGIELSHFRGLFGKDFFELYGEETQKLIGRGLLEQSGDALRLTPLGLDLANNVFVEYV